MPDRAQVPWTLTINPDGSTTPPPSGKTIPGEFFISFSQGASANLGWARWGYAAVGFNQIRGIAADDTYVYLSTAAGVIWRIGRDGTGLIQLYTTLLTTGTAEGIAVDSNYIYLAAYSDNNVYRVNKDGSGGKVTMVAAVDGAGGRCGGVAVDSRFIYAAATLTNNRISRTPIGSINSPPFTFISGCNTPKQISVDGVHIFWVNNVLNGNIGKANIDGTGITQPFVTVGANGTPSGVASDGTWVYYVDTALNTTNRIKVDGTGSQQPWINEVAGSNPYNIAARVTG